MKLQQVNQFLKESQRTMQYDPCNPEIEENEMDEEVCRPEMEQTKAENSSGEANGDSTPCGRSKENYE